MNYANKILKKGRLRKQGGIVRTWQERWFVLKGQSLLYYTKEDESKHQGTIELQGCKISELPYNRDEPDRWLFEISQVQRSGRANEAFLLWADSEAQRTEWTSSIRRAIYMVIGGGVFGGPLLQTTKYDHTHYGCDVPHVVMQCVELLLANGKEVEGIFRLNGRVSQVKQMRQRYDEGERPNLNQECIDVHTAASLLKLYFRELPEPVIPYEHFESFLNLATSFKYNSNHEETLKNLKTLVQQIPQENYKLLDYLTAFLCEISKYQNVNKMTEKNIAVIFGTNILRGLDDSPEFQMATQNLTTQIVLVLVKWHDKVFTEATESTTDDVQVSSQELELLVSLSEEPLETSSDPSNSATTGSASVDDLMGLDFTDQNNDQVFNDVEKVRRTPPPIPARKSQGEIDNRLSDPAVESDLQSSSSALQVNGSNMSLNDATQPAEITEPTAPVVKRRGASVKNRNRPTAFVQQPVPVERKSGTLPITKVERASSNFTSFIDSPLNSRVSLNIGDLPSSVEDLQALVLSLKLQLKEQIKISDSLTKEQKVQTLKHQQQMENLASVIYQERQAKDDAIARVVSLTNQLITYQSTFGSIADTH